MATADIRYFHIRFLAIDKFQLVDISWFSFTSLTVYIFIYRDSYFIAIYKPNSELLVIRDS